MRISQRLEIERGTVARGELVLSVLRLTLLAATAALVGVLGHIAWKIISG